MKRRLNALSALLTLSLATSALAEPVDLKPFINEHTLIVIHIDLTRMKFAELGPKLVDLIEPNLSTTNAEAAEAFMKFDQALAELGIHELNLVHGLNDLIYPPPIILNVTGLESTEKIKQLFTDLLKRSGVVVRKMHGAMVVGNEKQLAALERSQSSNRPDISAGLKVVEKAPFFAVFSLADNLKKALEQMTPHLPEEVGGGSIQVLTRGLKQVVLSVDTGPAYHAELSIECASPRSAEDIQQLYQNIIKTIRASIRADLQLDSDAIVAILDYAVKSFELKCVGNKLLMQADLGKEFKVFPPLLRSFHRSNFTLSMNHIKQIMLALFNFESTFGSFPFDITDAKGKPLLSWRVRLLPYLEQDLLFKQFHLNEPWDSEHNKKLIASMPKIFMAPGQNPRITGKTTYLAPRGKGLFMDSLKGKGTRINDICDGTSNSIAIVEVDDDQAVIWTRPDDYLVDPKNPTKGLLKHHSKGFIVGLCDGSARFIPKDYSSIWEMFTIAGGEVLKDK